MALTVDRDLPVPLSAQLRGLIEYGITCGELSPGARLPSVRELAEEAGVAPMTVSQVYRDLKEAGLIETRAGSGTFVAQRDFGVSSTDSRVTDLHRSIDALIDEGLALGLRLSDIAGLIGARLSNRHARARVQHIVLVGIFAAATAGYAQAVAENLGSLATVEAVTIDALEQSEEARRRAMSADLVLTMAHRRRDVAALLPRQRVIAIRFIPSEATRRALASIAPLASVLCVSRFPEFLPMMKPGVQRFAAHVNSIAATVVDAPDLDGLIGAHDVVVYATGAESVLDRLGPQRTAIEYRHMPDPGDIERLVRPLIDAGSAPAAADRKAS
ncbi:GntR family transcriptional regulator [Labrys monachus]|uniref:DNA-binding transcriptional regulator YhcF (GntR family) n=1 Tax=Labrys monachus TaxID=217067 RepID=A0ABU0FBQ7_9HYPH|nr:GntR family transcriptional regulator [Labrys monachus]MDQ0392047.1 DNA-binding transcriptional regulator YhcF (GntR family) [Labrys monachus]